MTDPKAEETIFAAVQGLPLEQRGTYLDQACRGDEALRRRIEALLEGYEASALLENPAASSLNPNAGSPFLTERIGDRIGRYKLLQQIGEGGCGVVYMAEQEEPVRRRVALKVIKLGMDTKQVIARFDAERQALALMDHPNIAKVLDAGATETGRPYFVMELVRGVKITKYCDENNLTTSQRLELFIQICRAIQHAHQKGVIHRDIKPTNILVTLHDGVAVPKVIDFGIAKATQGRLTDLTLFTAFEQFIGTPAYMSPEQAEMSGLDVDTRSDIYSLGVLLYELLTSKTPFDPQELMAAGLDAMRRTIRQKEPERPSTRLSTMAEGELTTTARRRHTEAPKLLSAVSGDLDWIVLKCLEKDRARRYETANGLGMDIERHLANEPVVARPPSNVYRFQKMVLRNKLMFAAAGAVLGVLIVGLGLSIWLLVRERMARHRAVTAEAKAKMEAGKSQQVANFLKAIFEGGNSWAGGGRDTTLLQEILDNTAKRVVTELTNQPEVQAELCMTIGDAYYGISGLPSGHKAEEMYRRVVTFLRGQTGKEQQLAEALSSVAETLRNQAKYAEAEPIQREAVEISRRLFPSGSKFLADRIWDLARTGFDQGKYGQSEALLYEAMSMYRKYSGDVSAGIARSHALHAWLDNKLGRLLEGERLIREQWSIQRRADAVDMWVIGALDWNLAEEGKFAEAEELGRQHLAMNRRRHAKDHVDIAGSLWFLSEMAARQGKLEEAIALAREALPMEKSLFEQGIREESSVADALIGLGSLLMAHREFSEAEPLVRDCVAIRERVQPDSWQSEADLCVLCEVLFECNKSGEAQALLRRDFQLIKYDRNKQRLDKIPERDVPHLSNTASNLARLYGAGSQTQLAEEWNAEAGKWYREELARYKKGADAGNVQSLNNLALFLATCPDPAVRDVANAVKFAEQAASETRREQPSILKTLAVAYKGAGQIAKAKEVEKETFDLLEYSKTNQFKWYHEEVQYYHQRVEKGELWLLKRFAWLLATCRDPTVRDGGQAVALAERAANMTQKDYKVLDILAAAYAELGEFSEAVRIENEALALMTDGRYKEDVENRLKLYQSGSPYREW